MTITARLGLIALLTATTTSFGLGPIPSASAATKEALVKITLDKPETAEGVGAAQGLDVRDGRVYIIGDSDTGILREYDVIEDRTLAFTGREVRLTIYGEDRLPHPTGLTFHPSFGTWLGNTVGGLGNIVLLDWELALATGTLDGAILHEVTDDAAVNGTRPEFVRLDKMWYLATSDYGSAGNQVRLYALDRLVESTRTSDPGVLVYQFSCGPWVQSLHWIDEWGVLVLVQNQTDFAGWRLTLVDLAGSVAQGEAQVVSVIDLSPSDELEGFHLLRLDRGIMVTSSQTQNVVFASLQWVESAK